MKIATLARSLLHLFLPHLCPGCGSDVLDEQQWLCLQCFSRLPFTYFHAHASNPIERIFYGRLPVAAATSHLYFTKDSILQSILHELKYHNQPAIGLQLGKLLAEAMQQSGRFNGIDAIVPVPLHPAREKKRGYNQAALLGKGIGDVMGVPLFSQAIKRSSDTESQTSKNKLERWQNMQNRFVTGEIKALEGKHVLLVDDVITTGATLEACGQILLTVPGVKLSIATLAFASR